MLSQHSVIETTLRSAEDAHNRETFYFTGVLIGDHTTLNVETDLDPASGSLIPLVLYGVIVRSVEGVTPAARKWYAYRVVGGEVLNPSGSQIYLRQGAFRFKMTLTLPAEYVTSADELVEWAVERSFTLGVEFRATKIVGVIETEYADPWGSTVHYKDIPAIDAVGTAGTLTYVAYEDATGVDALTCPADLAPRRLFRMWWQNQVNASELSYDPTTPLSNPDTDALAIWTQMGETDPDRQLAVNAFVKAQKRDGLWKNCEYMAIFHNDTWAKCALEWRNLSATLTKVGNCFSALNGISGSASGYVDSGFIPSAATKITQNSAELIVFAKYLPATGTNEGVLAGCQDTSGDGFTIDCSGTSGNINYAINSTTSASTAAGVRDNGLIVAKRVDNNSVRLYTRDYQQHADNSTNSTGLSTRPVYVGARNNDGTADKFTPATVAAMFVYPELSDAKHTKLLRNLQTYMTAVY